MKCLSFPVSFPCRPEDRLFKSYLVNQGVNADMAELMLYRAWRDFATGDSDRRLLPVDAAGKVEFSKSPAVALLEESSGFTGEPGKFVELAVKAGFMRLEDTGGGRHLVCCGFYPINASNGNGHRSKGARERARRNQEEKAADATRKHLELWKRNGMTCSLSEEQQRTALYFLQCVSRALYPLPLPADDVLTRPGGLLEKAWEIVVGISEEDNNRTLRWLIGKRKDPLVKTDLERVVASWREHVETARSEGS